jgi:hypothetical protein
MVGSLFYIDKRRYPAHPFQYLCFAVCIHAAAAVLGVLTRPLPVVVGVFCVDARRALSMNFEVKISGHFSMWLAAQ